MQIPQFRDPLRDTAEGIQGGLAGIAQGLMRAGQKRDQLEAEARGWEEQARVREEQRTNQEASEARGWAEQQRVRDEQRVNQADTEARVNAGSMKGEIAREISRLTALPEGSEGREERLAELIELSDSIQAVFAAQSPGDAASIWSSVMTRANVAPVLGGASGTATALERELDSANRIKAGNDQILMNLVGFLASNPNQEGYITQLGAQLSLAEALVNGGFLVSDAARSQLEALPGMIESVRNFLGADPQYRKYLDRLDIIQAAAAEKAGIETSMLRGDVYDRWVATGDVDPEQRAMLMNRAGLSDEAFDIQTGAYRERAEKSRASAVAATELTNRLLGIQVDVADHSFTVQKYRDERDRMLDSVRDGTSAGDFIRGAVAAGDTQMLTTIMREMEDPTSVRGQYWRDAGLTAQSLMNAMEEASVSEDYRRLSMQTARADAQRTLDAAMRAPLIDRETDRIAAMEAASRGLSPEEIDSWYDSLTDPQRAFLGSRDSVTRSMRQMSRLHQMTMTQPLRADAMSRASTLLGLPVPGAKDGQLSPESREAILSRAEEMYNILEPEFGDSFANQFRAGTQELLARGAMLWEWELLSEEWKVRLMQEQVLASQAARAARGAAPAGAADQGTLKLYLDGLNDAQVGAGRARDAIAALQQDAGCVGGFRPVGGITVWVEPRAEVINSPTCLSYASAQADQVNLSVYYSQQYEVVEEILERLTFGMPATMSPSTPSAPAPAPAAPAPAPAPAPAAAPRAPTAPAPAPSFEWTPPAPAGVVQGPARPNAQNWAPSDTQRRRDE
jgi:hypothetical protein